MSSKEFFTGLASLQDAMRAHRPLTKDEQSFLDSRVKGLFACSSTTKQPENAGNHGVTPEKAM